MPGTFVFGMAKLGDQTRKPLYGANVIIPLARLHVNASNKPGPNYGEGNGGSRLIRSMHSELIPRITTRLSSANNVLFATLSMLIPPSFEKNVHVQINK